MQKQNVEIHKRIKKSNENWLDLFVEKVDDWDEVIFSSGSNSSSIIFASV